MSTSSLNIVTFWHATLLFVSDSLDMKWEDESDDAEEEGMEHVEKGYRGIHLTFPLKRADLELLIDTFRKRKVYPVIFI